MTKIEHFPSVSVDKFLSITPSYRVVLSFIWFLAPRNVIKINLSWIWNDPILAFVCFFFNFWLKMIIGGLKVLGDVAKKFWKSDLRSRGRTTWLTLSLLLLFQISNVPNVKGPMVPAASDLCCCGPGNHTTTHKHKRKRNNLISNLSKTTTVRRFSFAFQKSTGARSTLVVSSISSTTGKGGSDLCMCVCAAGTFSLPVARPLEQQQLPTSRPRAAATLFQLAVKKATKTSQ